MGYRPMKGVPLYKRGHYFHRRLVAMNEAMEGDDRSFIASFIGVAGLKDQVL